MAAWTVIYPMGELNNMPTSSKRMTSVAINLSQRYDQTNPQISETHRNSLASTYPSSLQDFGADFVRLEFAQPRYRAKSYRSGSSVFQFKGKNETCARWDEAC